MSDLFYNRDRNIIGVTELTGLTISPTYGSSVSFSTRASEVKYPNRVLRRMGQSLNSVIAEYNLSFKVRDEEAAQILNYFESRSGTLPVVMQDASNIYQTISGFADDFSWTARSNTENEVAARIVIDNRSPQLNWSGLSFVNQDIEQWKIGESVNNYAIRYFEADNQNKFNNFFYCTGNHVSSPSNAPFSTGSMWTQNLFLDTAFEYSVATKPDVSRIEFSNSFYQRVYDKKNIHSIENLNLKFNGLTDTQTKSLLHFVESKFGELKFIYRAPKIYNRDKIFFCPSWRHTWVYKNSNNIELDLIEDTLGVLLKNNSPAILINQHNDESSIKFTVDSINDFFLLSYNGGEKFVQVDGLVDKHWVNSPETVGIYGAATGVFIKDQRIESFSLSDRSSIKSLSLPSNTISQALVSDSRKLEHLDLTSNSLSELSIAGLTNLKSLKIANNRISTLDTYSNSSLTGLYCSGNKFSSTQINNCLDAFVNFQNHSGVFDLKDGEFVDFQNNEKIGSFSFNNINTLGWRGWTINADNVKIPLDVSGYGYPICHFQQDTLKDSKNGESIFTWRDSIRNYNASRSVVTDSLRPRFDELELNARPALYFNGESYLTQSTYLDCPNQYAIFAVVKPQSNGTMSVFSDYWNRGMMISNNRLYSKTNLGNTFFAELSGNSYNVVGIYGGAAGIITGAVNTQTPSTGLKVGNSNIVFPGSIGINRYGSNGVLSTGHDSQVPAPFIGHISEIVVMTGDVNFSLMMRDLGAKHGLEIL
jgi:phage-related protein